MHMFVRSALALAVALTFVGSQAQAQLTVGARGGVSVASASVDISETFSQENQTGFTGGAFLDFNGGMLGLQVAAQYATKGTKLSIGDELNDLTLGNLEIPAVVKVGLPLGMIKPSVFGGAGLSFVMSCDVNDVDCKDDVKSTEWQGIAGADLAIYLGGLSLWVDGRYHFGLSNISDAADVISDLKNKHWTFQGGVGFGF
jgi:hypothetical protein